MKPLIIIDPGHGGRDPGGGSNEYWLEKDMVLKISKYQYERLKALGIPVQLTRNDDVYLSSSQRAKIVRDSEAKYCISNHINAGGGEGAETIHSIYSDAKLATKILDQIRQAGQKTRRVFYRTLSNSPHLDYYFMHRETGNVETVIVEYGFADQKEDTDRLLNHWKDYAEAVIKAICEHIGHNYQKSFNIDKDSWKHEGVEYLYKEGILNDLQGWKQKINEPMPVWAVTLLLKKICEKLKEES
ncbi:N-acetylmuramoyl-L-alanine amidase family protein [Crassaminicella indica]|uniref:N-acetylmuramoyl-L-alanine amidase n=1 Tax=Crassaminicella indica TaxID=2855394 RepID=A0ABX8REJ7_9CLOT|nr:N-acetylmuramoyl-L-alanine amidase [Crassaminicella indica]QXM06335.1 N-acetylmuramoyl-L-alanine amidase [Crassaminicella indica]